MGRSSVRWHPIELIILVTILDGRLIGMIQVFVAVVKEKDGTPLQVVFREKNHQLNLLNSIMNGLCVGKSWMIPSLYIRGIYIDSPNHVTVYIYTSSFGAD